MAPEVNVVERQNLCEGRVRHERSKSESHKDPESSQLVGSVFQDYRRGSRGPKQQTSLIEDGILGKRSCQGIHDRKAHSEPLNKQPELFSKSSDVPETRSNTRTSDTLSENELPNSQARLEKGQDAEATIKRELEVEHNAHSDTKAKLQSTIDALENVEKKLKEKKRSHAALASMHNDAQQRFKEREQYVQALNSQQENHYQSIVLAKDEDLKALQIQLETVSKKSEESLKAIKMEADAAIRERDEAFKFCEILKGQLEALRKGNEDRTLRMQEQLDGSIRELDAKQEKLEATQGKLEATQDKLAKSRSKADKIISKLREELQTADEDCQTSKDLYEAQRSLNKTLHTKNNQLEKRSSDAKDKLKELHTVHRSEQSQFNDQITELKAREKTVTAEKEKLQGKLDSHIVQHNEHLNDLLQQVRESQGLSQRYNFRLSDEEIVDEWQNLRHMIRQFVDKYTRPVEVPQAQLNSTLRMMSPLMSKLLASSLHFAFAFEAYVWECMSLTVFDPFSLVWAGELGRTFSKLSWRVEDQIRSPGVDDELTSEYHGWRATSSNLLSRVGQRDSHNLSQHGDVVALIDGLQALLGSDDIKDDVYRDLTNIVDNARAFDIMRRKVKSKIEVCFGASDVAGVAQKCNMPVDDSFMRIRVPKLEADFTDSNTGPGPTVKLMVSPAIVRWGNNNGVDYDRKACLVKMDVFVSQMPNVVTQLPAEPAPAAGGGQLGQRSNTADEGRHSVRSHAVSGKQVEPTGKSTFWNQTTQHAQAPKIKKEMHTETGHSTPPHPSGQSARQGQALSRSSSTGQTSQPRSADQNGTKKRRASELEQRNQSDELSGGPDDHKSPRDPKPTATKKRKSGSGGNSQR